MWKKAIIKEESKAGAYTSQCSQSCRGRGPSLRGCLSCGEQHERGAAGGVLATVPCGSLHLAWPWQPETSDDKCCAWNKILCFLIFFFNTFIGTQLV